MLFGDVLDRFQVKAPLARGGMGELWLARDEAAHAGVVLKTIRPDLIDDEDVVTWFRREIDVTARLDHAHVSRHVAHGSWQGRDVLALEHIPGVNLAAVLARTRLSLASSLQIAEDISSALAYVHDLKDEDGAPLGVVHADVSPQNILIDVTGNARLIDFGAVLLRGRGDERDSIVGKPGYLSPEQSRCTALDGRSDQYSLGVVLWEMLSGCDLFEGDARRRGREIPPLASFTETPVAVDDIVQRMLRYETDARFADMDAVTAAVGAQLTPALRARARGLLAGHARRRRRRAPWMSGTRRVTAAGFSTPRA